MQGWVADLRRDAVYAVRQLRRSPGFAIVAVATLALGIAASTALFTVVDGVLLRPLRFPEPQRLVALRPSSGSRVSTGYLHDWRAGSRTLRDVAGWADAHVTLTGLGEPIEVPIDRVTVNFFALLGTPAAVGRTFTVGTGGTDVPHEAVLSFGLWQRRFGGDRAIVGRPLTLDGDTFTVVGVMPNSFRIRTNELPESRAEAWVPFRLTPDYESGMGGFLNVVARLAPGATVEQARAELNALSDRIEADHPSFTRSWRVDVVPLLDATVRDVRATLLVLFGSVGILLLIACVNVSTLVLGRASARQVEIAVRASLGASSSRLIRQLLAEALVLAAAAGSLAVLLSTWALRALIVLLPAALDMPRAVEIAVDVRMLTFAVGVTTLTVVAVGLIPAVDAARPAAGSLLRAGARGGGSSPRRTRASNALIVVEVALALVLISGAGLLTRSFVALMRVQPGFHSDGVVTMRTSLPEASYDSDDRIRTFGRALLERVQGLATVQAIGFANYLPLSDTGVGATFTIEGRPEPRPDERPSCWVNVVGGRYFDAMGIPLLRGRLPGPRDTDTTEPVVVIDQALAARYWPADDPIGRRVAFQRNGAAVMARIVGIVGNVRWAALSEEPNATTYFWFPQDPRRDLTIVARVAGNPLALPSALSAAVKAIDPAQPVADIRLMSDFVAASVARPRFTMLLITAFAIVALALAGIGVFGVIAFSVAQRTREIGVRVALGAQSRDVLALVMRRGTGLIALGVIVGALAGLALGQTVRGLLYGITPQDPIALIGSIVFVAGVGLTATYLPARRAVRIDPMTALRSE